jgi:aerobic-type carbon monoxide dehydrogenase small subunit (CoxS/CutS family)
MKPIEIRLNVNGEARCWQTAPGAVLLDVLRREGYHGVKRGCETGECGACTVLLDGKAVNSCLVFAAQADGCEILTIEGVAEGERLHPIQEAFLDAGAVQCGFCTPGMVLNAKAFLDRCPQPSEAEVRKALAGNYCRCTGYKKPVEAVLAAAANCGLQISDLRFRPKRSKSEIRNPKSEIRRGRR